MLDLFWKKQDRFETCFMDYIAEREGEKNQWKYIFLDF